MADMNDYLEAALLNHIFRNTAYTSPGTDVWIALYTTATTDTGGGTEVTDTGAYVRILVQGTGAWDDPAGAGATANTGAISFTQATATWGTVTHTAVIDSCSDTGTDNMLMHGSLTSSKTVNNGDTFSFAAGDFDVTMA